MEIIFAFLFKLDSTQINFYELECLQNSQGNIVRASVNASKFYADNGVWEWK